MCRTHLWICGALTKDKDRAQPGLASAVRIVPQSI